MEKMNKSQKIIFVDDLTSINEIETLSNSSDVKIISNTNLIELINLYWILITFNNFIMKFS